MCENIYAKAEEGLRQEPWMPNNFTIRFLRASAKLQISLLATAVNEKEIPELDKIVAEACNIFYHLHTKYKIAFNPKFFTLIYAHILFQKSIPELEGAFEEVERKEKYFAQRLSANAFKLNKSEIDSIKSKINFNKQVNEAMMKEYYNALKQRYSKDLYIEVACMPIL